MSGCTDSLALVNKAIPFNGPPDVLCSTCRFFSSEREINLFIILTNLTSTICQVGLSFLALLEREKGRDLTQSYDKSPTPTDKSDKQRDNTTRHVFVNHGCPRQQQSQNMAKISKSYILTPPHPQGHVMSVKCEEPIDELTVQVWLLYYHRIFKYCTLFVSRTELRTDGQTNRQTDGQTDDPITRCPRRTFQAGGIITPPKTSTTQRLQTNLGQSVGVTTLLVKPVYERSTFPPTTKEV